LDEPTNHLDAQTRDSLADALARFDGALLLVSHDRYLLRSSVDRFVIVTDGRLMAYDGDLDDYDAWVMQQREAAVTSSGGPASRTPDAQSPGDMPATGGGSDRRSERRLAAERRSALAALTRDIDTELRKVEARLEQTEAELKSLDAALQSPELYAPGSDGSRVSDLNRRRASVSRERDDIETRWLELQTQREEQVAAFETKH
jgi:ATP-binding cassette subfamily F protein 3